MIVNHTTYTKISLILTNHTLIHTPSTQILPPIPIIPNRTYLQTRIIQEIVPIHTFITFLPICTLGALIWTTYAFIAIKEYLEGVYCAVLGWEADV